ncbi:polymorphic toxin-type HINT domain-containing protein [Spongiactinospora sp. TRM90649]|uniref:polymorphic toxin-type HINT domain-containing protein n=1 Tax=Spongiactinospora sp. TRM90649 TaxID=3031114 RepID=UPI0023F62088|nr:polymorphic toxin-type HINT domain-containing protein [Spongiactinospora sp. TRM90649]MDF5757493.1 polymorphic toxin-type HINT domain-containing protein [Spongiactinospora sp. TRM90649]
MLTLSVLTASVLMPYDTATAAELGPVPQAVPGQGPAQRPLPPGVRPSDAVKPGQRPPVVPLGARAEGKPVKVAEGRWTALTRKAARPAAEDGFTAVTLRPGYVLADTSLVTYFDNGGAGATWTGARVRLYDAESQTEQASSLVTKEDLALSRCGTGGQFCRSFGAADGWVLDTGKQYFVTVAAVYDDGREVVSDPSEHANPRQTYDPPPVPNEQAAGCGCGNALALTAAGQASRALGVNTGTGAYVRTEQDFGLASFGPRFATTRTYSSMNRAPGPFGPGWAWSYGMRVTPAEDGGAKVLAEDGAQATYAAGEDGAYKRPPGVRSTLRKTDGGWVLTTPRQARYVFDSQGRLTSVLNARGVGVKLAYEGLGVNITDASGRKVEVRIEGGLIREIKLPDGRNVNYSYNAAGLLSQALDARGFQWRYTYHANGLLSQVVDPHRVAVVSNEYGADGRMTAQRDGLGKRTTFAWDAAKQEATTTDPDGVVTWDGYRGNTLVYTQRGTGDSDNHRYDRALNRDLVVNGNQYQHEAIFDGNGNRVEVKAPQPMKFSEKAKFDERNNPTEHVDANGQVWKDTYNEFNELVRSEDPEGNAITHEYDSRGLRTSTTDQRGKVTRYEYLPQGGPNAGLLSARVSPEGRRTEQTYDLTGRRITTTDPRGTVTGGNRAAYTTKYAYDAQDRLLSTLDPGKIGAWRSGFDETGRLVRQQTPTGGTKNFTYLANGLLQKVDDERRTTLYTYTDGGRQATSAAQLRTRAPIVTSYTYDGKGLLKTVTSPRGNEAGANKADFTTTYFYDANDNPVRVRHPYPGGGFVDRDIKVDPLDRTTSRTDELGKQSSFARDNAGDLTSTTDTLGRTTKMEYDRSGRQTGITDSGGKTTKTEYDKAGNRIKETGAEGGVTTWKYDDDGLLVAVTEPRGNVEGADPDRYTTRYEYDRAGNQVKSTDPLGNASTATYDGVNRLIATTDAKGRTSHTTYREDDLLATVHTPETPYNPNDPTVRSTVYSYAPDGMLESVRDPLGRYTRMAYDDAGRLITRADPLSRRVEITYDAENNPLAAITINGPEWVSPEERAKRTVTSTYDILNRRTKTALGSQGPAYTFGYDGKDRTTAYGDPTGVRNVVYDDEDQIKTITRKTQGRADETFTYGYDERGNITSRTYPDGTKVTGAYDGDSRLTEQSVAGGVAGDGAREWKFGYDVAGRRTTTTLPTGGLTEKRAYDDAGRLTSIRTADGDADPVSAFNLTLDQVGNPTKVVTRRGDRTEDVAYAYDLANRVTSACYSATECGTGTQAAGRIDYTYDLMGNRLSQKRTGTAGNDTTTYTYDVADQLLKETVAKPGSTVSKDFAYDVNGNQIRSGSDRFEYNLDNSLAKATVGNNTATFTYDATGLRLSAATTATTSTGAGTQKSARVSGTQWWSWDVNGNLPQIALDTTTNSAGTVIESRGFAFGPDDEPLALLTGGAAHAYTHDWLGGVANMLSPTGQVEAGYDYDPFGNPRTGTTLSPATANKPGAPTANQADESAEPAEQAAPENPLRYTGAYQDETTGAGNYYLRDRNYNPGTGRFSSVDPMPSGTSATSAYTYASNNPLVYTDPTGMRPDEGPTTTGETAPGQEAEQGPSAEDVAKAQQLQNKSVLDVILEAGGQILMEILGINDIVNCLQGDLGACVSAVVGALPWGKIFKAPKIIAAIWRAGKAVITFFQELKWAKAILRGAEKAAEAAKAAAAKAAKAAADKAAAAKAAAEAQAKKLAAEAAERAKALAAKAKAKTKPKSTAKPQRKPKDCPNSFAPGTLVLMANGTTKAIERVGLGEKVVATDPETGKTAAKPVVRQILGEGAKDLVRVTVDGGKGKAPQKLVATDGHPFWVQSERAWLEADQLKAGMWLRTSAGTHVQVTAVEQWTARERVYNFTIADIHTYYVVAGGTSVLVHNCEDEPVKLYRSPQRGNRASESQGLNPANHPVSDGYGGTAYLGDSEAVARQYAGKGVYEDGYHEYTMKPGFTNEFHPSAYRRFHDKEGGLQWIIDVEDIPLFNEYVESVRWIPWKRGVHF